MPINIPNKLPANEILTNENIFVMNEDRATHQDVRPLKIAILNIMPTKIVTETQLLRLIGNTAIQVDIVLLHPRSHRAKNTSEQHLKSFYKTFYDIRHSKFDGLIITGAPVELLDFEEVTYWKELREIMEWSLHNVFSTMYICWGAQAGLYYHYGVPKHALEKKVSGVYKHKVKEMHVPLLRGFDDEFFAPHSRYTEVTREEIEKTGKLDILAESDEAGIYIVKSKEKNQIFVTGHPEYDALTLKAEYDRDIGKGLDIHIPVNYFPGDDPTKTPTVRWRGHANLLFANWLNYYVYQETPYDLEKL